MNKITVVFPMAGEGQRFGNKFKPFLKIFNKTFIELAIEPFLKHKDEIKEFVFIFRGDHQIQFKVIDKLAGLNLPCFVSYIGVTPTKNVIETISPLFDGKKFLTDIIFCDCDHSLNVDALFRAIQKDEFDCIVPGWEILPVESKNWSIAAVDANNIVKGIAEKKYPLPAERFYGVIGCYYFKRITQPDSEMIKYLSDVIELFVSNGKVKLVPIKEADFFGDPQRLENLYISKKASTIFCDLDGTVIEHENIPDYTKGIKLLDGAKETIDKWRNNHAFIVLTTSRDEQFRPEMEQMLRDAGVRYEYLVMGLPPGPRYLINDKKPYSDIEMAGSFEVERNVGIKSIGHSFANFGVKDQVGIKSIPKDAPQHQWNKFKAQYESMKSIRLNPELANLIPTVSNFTNESYNIEFLKNYKGLHQFSATERLVILENLFTRLTKLYNEKVEFRIYWLFNFIQKKIETKRQDIIKLGQSDKAIDSIIDIAKNHSALLTPQFLCRYFHGDLTYENIMVKGEDIKFIDLDNDNLSGPPELDLGKLMQSILTDYEFWDNPKTHNHYKEFEKVIGFYGGLLNQHPDEVIIKAYFYCALHLIRMIPYQAKTNIERAKKALAFAEKFLNVINMQWNTSTKIL